LYLTARPPPPTPFPYTTLFRSLSKTPRRARLPDFTARWRVAEPPASPPACSPVVARGTIRWDGPALHRSAGTLGLRGKIALALRSEEHTSELQSRENLVCRLLL